MVCGFTYHLLSHIYVVDLKEYKAIQTLGHIAYSNNYSIVSPKH